MSSEFNLVDEPWIPVLDAGGTERELSLREVFTQAPELVAISGELPTQSVALLRLLLAILHRAVAGPVDFDHWKQLRENWDAVVAEVTAYLDDYHDRFWLFDDQRPFMQVATLHTARDEVSDLAKIICDGPGTSPFLTTRVGAALERLSPAEAARWLIHTQAYDVSGIKSGAVGDPRVKGGKGYPIGTGWAGQIGAVHLVGDTLQDTLLLNLLAPASAGLPEIDVYADKPVWERDPLTELPETWQADGGAEQAYRQPTGPVDLYTWPARRIRLVGDGSEVTGVVLAQGDRATPQNRQTVEPMTAWRYSDPQTKKFSHDTYMPNKHLAGRAFWRGLEALLPRSGQSVRSARPGGPPSRLPPALSKWAARLETEHALTNANLRWRSVGVEYGSNESVYDDITVDEVTLPGALFVDSSLADLAIVAVQIAESCARALGNLAQNIALAAGASTENDGPTVRASAEAYAELDREFRDWVRNLGPYADHGEQRLAWEQAVNRIGTRLGDKLVDSAGPAAFVGRTVSGQFRDAGLALVWFQKALRDALPHVYPARNPEPTTAGDSPVAGSREVDSAFGMDEKDDE